MMIKMSNNTLKPLTVDTKAHLKKCKLFVIMVLQGVVSHNVYYVNLVYTLKVGGGSPGFRG